MIAKNEQIRDLDAHVGQLEGLIEERDVLLDNRDADFALLEQQFTAQQVQLDNALDHIEVLEAQQAQPEAMEEEPQEVQGVSGLTLRREFPCHHLRELTPPLEASRPSTTLTTFR